MSKQFEKEKESDSATARRIKIIPFGKEEEDEKKEKKNTIRYAYRHEESGEKIRDIAIAYRIKTEISLESDEGHWIKTEISQGQSSKAPQKLTFATSWTSKSSRFNILA